MKTLRPLRWLLIALAATLIPVATSRAEVVISVGFAPPPLLVYDQPPCPEQGLIWMPGYWAYGPDGYYWVPGAWVPAPFEGALWTPGYWGWSAGLYYWHPGYWGRNVGYYGGINYGYGYFGIGFVGGRWNGGFFEYNTAVWHVNTTIIHRTYRDRDWKHHYVDRNSHVAFNGGPGGIRHQPDARERTYMREPRTAHTTFQTRHMEAARNDRNAYYNVNHGRPQRVVSWQPLDRENRAPDQRDGFNNTSRGNENGARNRNEPNRGGQPSEGNRNNQQPRPQPPQNRAQPGYQPVPPQIHQQPQPRQQPESRPQPQQPRSQPQYRTQPEYRPVPPQVREQPQPQQPDSRPQPQQPRSQPQDRTQPEYRPAPPQVREQPQPQYRPQPERRQQPQSRPEPQSRPQQQNRAQPQQRPENRGNDGDRQQHENRGHER